MSNEAKRVETMRLKRAAERAQRRADWRAAHDDELEARGAASHDRRLERRALNQAAHAAATEERRLAQERSRQDRRLSAHPNDYSHTDARFEEDMAASLGISVDEFRRRQEANREAMEDKPQIGYSPDHTVH